MRILEKHVDPVSGFTYAVICNPVADTPPGFPVHRYRLICAQIPDWIKQVETTRSVSRTPGIVIYEEFDVLEAWEGLERTNKKIEAFKREARDLGRVLRGAHHLTSDRRTP